MSELENIEAQQELPLAIPEEVVVPDGATSERHVFSGRLVAKREPERYRLFCALYFDAGLGQMQICDLLKMSPQTGAAIIAAECASRPAKELRQKQAARGRAVMSLALSAIQERLSDPDRAAEIPVRDLALVVQRAGELAQLMEGEPTQRHEHTVKPPKVSDDDASDYLSRGPSGFADVEIPADLPADGEGVKA